MNDTVSTSMAGGYFIHTTAATERGLLCAGRRRRGVSPAIGGVSQNDTLLATLSGQCGHHTNGVTQEVVWKLQSYLQTHTLLAIGKVC